MSVRVRFAPSPTGPLHIGGVRTALYNYLFAKKNNGKFILRIEDTDQTRFVEGAEEYILEALKWLGISPDEGQQIGGDLGPYKQSERKTLYKQYIQELLEKDKAYYAFDTPDELGAIRKEYEARKEVFSYDAISRKKMNNSLNLTTEEVKEKIEKGVPYVIRFKMPENEDVLMKDLVRGTIKVNTSTLDDKVLFKSDGLPTYHFANIVDDHLMEITHVIRGEEWLPSLPLHVMLYRAFDWNTPEFAHLALILKPTGKGKLSKRDGIEGGFPIFPLTYGESIGYKEEGYFPEAVVNMLALLGWNPGTEQEFFSLDELVKVFDLNKVSKSGARFSKDKAVWFNHHYLQEHTSEDLLAEYKTLVDSRFEDTILLKIINLVKERANFVKDLVEQSQFFFETPTQYAEKAYKKAWKEGTSDLMVELKKVIEGTEDFAVDSVQVSVKEWIKSKEIGFGKVMQPLRLALVGDMKGPDLFEIMNILGKDETIKRIENIINYK
ncbi:glutamate--tRNA(Gln) ligase [Flavobacteriaceae bacterium UJ101]|nr:glutamate--tRNA(Gln) ligase [Flavobacteriaceae bacterium UJ101]